MGKRDWAKGVSAVAGIFSAGGAADSNADDAASVASGSVDAAGGGDDFVFHDWNRGDHLERAVALRSADRAVGIVAAGRMHEGDGGARRSLECFAACRAGAIFVFALADVSVHR